MTPFAQGKNHQACMDDWTSGFTAEIDSTFGYYQEFNPLFLTAGLH